MAKPTLTVVFERLSELEAQLGHLSRGGCFLPEPVPLPEPFAELDVVFVAPSGDKVRFDARVVQLAPGAGVAVTCDDAATTTQQLRSLIEGATAGEAGHPARAVWGDSVQAAESDSEAPLADRIRDMKTPEKIRLALHGERAARILLVKDTNKTIHSFILKNKGITVDEVRYIAGNRQCAPDALKLIGENREWVGNPRILSALISNPKTPGSIATKLLNKLPKAELRRIAKSQSVPRAVSMAAKKLVI